MQVLLVQGWFIFGESFATWNAMMKVAAKHLHILHTPDLFVYLGGEDKR